MATKKANTPKYLETVDSTIDTMISKAGDLHTATITTAENLVDETYRAGGEWTKLIQKALKGGVKIYGKQQDLAIDTLEGVISQYGAASKKAQKLIGFNIVDEVKAKTVGAKDAFDNAVANVSDKIEHAVNGTDDEIKSTATKAKKVVLSTFNKAKQKASATVNMIQDEITKSDLTKKASVKAKANKNPKVKVTKKVTATQKKATSTKAATKVVTTAKKATPVKVIATKLTDINGIGPKTMSILVDAGIQNIAELAATTSKNIDAILEGKGKIYTTVNTQDWISEAKQMTK